MTKTFTWLILLMLTFIISQPVKVGEMAWNEDARIDEVMPSRWSAGTPLGHADESGAGHPPLAYAGGLEACLVPPIRII